MYAYKIKEEWFKRQFDDFNKSNEICSFCEFLYYMCGVYISDDFNSDFFVKNKIPIVKFIPNKEDADRIVLAYLETFINDSYKINE